MDCIDGFEVISGAVKDRVCVSIPMDIVGRILKLKGLRTKGL